MGMRRAGHANRHPRVGQRLPKGHDGEHARPAGAVGPPRGGLLTTATTARLQVLTDAGSEWIAPAAAVASRGLAAFRRASWPEERERHDRDAVLLTAVRVLAGGDDDHVRELVAELALEPEQVAHVPVVDQRGELRLDGDPTPVVAGDDEVDLVVTVASAQVPDARLGRLSEHPHGECDKGLEQGAEKHPVPWRGRLGAPAAPRDGVFLGALFESLVALTVRVFAQAAEASVGAGARRNG